MHDLNVNTGGEEENVQSGCPWIPNTCFKNTQ